MKKKKIQIKDIVTIGIRILFFVLFPAIFATAFSGVKYVFVQLGAGELLQWNSFLMTLVFLGIFTIICGRYFCGFACAFGTYGDFIYWISKTVRKKRKKKPHKMPKEVAEILRFGKYIVLLIAVLLCYFGKSNTISENSPWTVFSRLQSFSLPEIGIGVVLLILITVGMYFEERFFCRFLCPMGAVFSILSILPAAQVSRNREACGKGCRACSMKCPVGIELPETREEDTVKMGECISCGKCVEICPKGNCQTLVSKKKDYVWLERVGKAVILLLVCYLSQRS